jgi:hypothetical protein
MITIQEIFESIFLAVRLISLLSITLRERDLLVAHNKSELNYVNISHCNFIGVMSISNFLRGADILAQRTLMTITLDIVVRGAVATQQSHQCPLRLDSEPAGIS